MITKSLVDELIKEHVFNTRRIISYKSGIQTINSVSGGRTSSYMAVHYPADLNVFSLVRCDDPSQSPLDPAITRYCESKIPGFIATTEVDQTLKALMDLEQLLGKTVIWITAKRSFDEEIRRHNTLPSLRMRFCTEELKIRPVYDWVRGRVYSHRLGFRLDEARRVYKAMNAKKVKGEPLYDVKSLGDCKRVPRSSKRELWRYLDFPLWMDGVNREHVNSWAENSGIVFPSVSDCAFCFHHTPDNHRQQLQDNPHKLQWWLDMERETGHTFADVPLKTRLNDYGKPSKTGSCACG